MDVTEIVQLTALLGRGDEYRSQLELALGVIMEDPECHAVAAYRGIEDPDTFVVEIEWMSVAAHYTWRESPDMERYRAFVAHLERRPPEFAHYERVHRVRSGTASDG